ncbi:MAG TPA: PHB depolymerase family esterase, partial [Candidatus Limnocylindrales bacterium]|nr:PHB depolymerase family esterase [Candidatus Limnocylindrales bacterium]
MPLIVQLHGRGIDAIRFDLWTGLAGFATERGWAVALPAAVGEIWNDGRWTGTEVAEVDDIGFIDAVIVDAAARLPIDPRRVYLAGMSNGASMAGRYVCERPAGACAVAQVAGTAAESVVAGCQPGRPVPLLQIHGAVDRFAPYGGGRAAGPMARFFVRRRAEPMVGVDAWAEHWVRVNGAVPAPSVQHIGAATTIRRWSGATPRSDVEFIRIGDGGHTWPGARAWIAPIFGRVNRELDATAAIWSFFESHPGPPPEAAP